MDPEVCESRSTHSQGSKGQVGLRIVKYVDLHHYIVEKFALLGKSIKVSITGGLID
jgi:hypothetical protein